MYGPSPTSSLSHLRRPPRSVQFANEEERGALAVVKSLDLSHNELKQVTGLRPGSLVRGGGTGGTAPFRIPRNSDSGSGPGGGVGNTPLHPQLYRGEVAQKPLTGIFVSGGGGDQPILRDLEGGGRCRGPADPPGWVGSHDPSMPPAGSRSPPSPTSTSAATSSVSILVRMFLLGPLF